MIELTPGKVAEYLREHVDEWREVTITFWRIEENAAIRGLFAQAGGVVRDQALAGELAAMARKADSDFTVSALDAANDKLRSALIRLHAHVEELDGEPARALEAAIWGELRQSVKRREISLANF